MIKLPELRIEWNRPRPDLTIEGLRQAIKILRLFQTNLGLPRWAYKTREGYRRARNFHRGESRRALREWTAERGA